ncbi:MAG: DUF4230 domain-containing protein [Spirulinaceae cyanobacterium SM2_1_0]|nr:DUF4230 domain-containing protein [Spirulinaceae cyanobacterium SM2_1_0]
MSDRRTASPLQRLLTPLQFLLWAGTGSALLFLALALADLRQAGTSVSASVDRWLNPTPAQPEIDPSTAIVQQIRHASELTTAVMAMETVIPTRKDRKLGELRVGTTRLLYIARGEVEAGIDLSQVAETDVTIMGDTVQVQLPPPQILDSQLDLERSQVYDYDRGFLSLGPDAAPELQTLAQQATLERMVRAACQQGLLDRANERAEIVIAQLLNLSGQVNVEAIATPPDPATCARVPVAEEPASSPADS